MDTMKPTEAAPIRRYGLNEEGRIFMLEDDQPDSLAHFANLEDHRALLVRLAWSETARRCSELAAREAEQERDELRAEVETRKVLDKVMVAQRDEMADALTECHNHALAISDKAADLLRRLGRLA